MVLLQQLLRHIRKNFRILGQDFTAAFLRDKTLAYTGNLRAWSFTIVSTSTPWHSDL